VIPVGQPSTRLDGIEAWLAIAIRMPQFSIPSSQESFNVRVRDNPAAMGMWSKEWRDF
jgi:hypothetical protein